MLDHLQKLSSINGVSGFESEVAAYIRKELEGSTSVESIVTDRLGNCIVQLKGQQPAAHRLVMAAHMDEVGGIITGITDDGYLRFDAVGGVMPSVMYARCVTVNGHVGVIGGKAIHQCKDKEKTTVPSLADMRVDIGANSREEAEAIVSPGDAVYFIGEYTPLCGNRFKAKALDDRVGCALLLQLAKTQPKYDVTLIFTVQEEVGLRGAAVAANATQPDYAVIIDATTAADTVGVAADKQVCCVGSGPVVSFMDRRTLYDHSLYTHIMGLAKENHIPAQTKTTVAGGNDAGAFQTAGSGVKVAAVSLPCRYIHSPSCVLDTADVDNTYRLLELLMNTLPVWDETV